MTQNEKTSRGFVAGSLFAAVIIFPSAFGMFGAMLAGAICLVVGFIYARADEGRGDSYEGFARGLIGLGLLVLLCALWDAFGIAAAVLVIIAGFAIGVLFELNDRNGKERG